MFVRPYRISKFFIENVHKCAYNQVMDNEYEWDPKKSASNLRKHGIAFTDAVIALEDDLALTRDDDHPNEKRYVTIGADDVGQILVVVYTYRGEKNSDHIGESGHPARA